MLIFRVSCRVIVSHTNNALKNNQYLFKTEFVQQQKVRYMTSLPGTTSFATKLDSDNLNIHQKYQIYQRKYYSQDNMNKKNAQGQKIVAHEITKNITLVSNDPQKISVIGKTMKLNKPIDKPLVVMFSWMLARKKHLLKYAKIYTDLGFNVMTIELTPWQLLWPTKGSQLVAADALNFLEKNVEFSPLMIHGFSVGGYLWGEIMALMTRDLPRYQDLLSRIHCQIWDSAADITEIPVGLPKAIFPNNKTLQNALRNYVVYHLRTFHDVATVHYARSSQLFHFTLLKAPSLFLVSELDPVGAVGSNKSVKDDMESAGIKTSWKCWKDTHHVLHYSKHPEEYLRAISKHLEESGIFGRIADKARAKL